MPKDLPSDNATKHEPPIGLAAQGRWALSVVMAVLDRFNSYFAQLGSSPLAAPEFFGSRVSVAAADAVAADGAGLGMFTELIRVPTPDVRNVALRGDNCGTAAWTISALRVV